MKTNEIIRDLREDRDFYQKDIADLLQISRQYYGDYEKGKFDLPLRHLKTLCLFYNVSADYILGLPQGMPYPKR